MLLWGLVVFVFFFWSNFKLNFCLRQFMLDVVYCFIYKSGCYVISQHIQPCRSRQYLYHICISIGIKLKNDNSFKRLWEISRKFPVMPTLLFYRVDIHNQMFIFFKYRKKMDLHKMHKATNTPYHTDYLTINHPSWHKPRQLYRNTTTRQPANAVYVRPLHSPELGKIVP